MRNRIVTIVRYVVQESELGAAAWATSIISAHSSSRYVSRSILIGLEARETLIIHFMTSLSQALLQLRLAQVPVTSSCGMPCQVLMLLCPDVLFSLPRPGQSLMNEEGRQKW